VNGLVLDLEVSFMSNRTRVSYFGPFYQIREINTVVAATDHKIKSFTL
jgi:hypothetical protein